jgi:hypothetical protein
MDDPNYLRKVNLDEIDFSKYSKDYSAEELAAVKQALQQEQKRHVESFDSLPLLDRAKYHVGDMANFVQQNPETLYGIATGALLAGAGAKAVGKTADTAKKVHGSLRDLMSSKADDGLLANQQAEKAIKQAEMTSKEATSLEKPTTGVDTTTDVGKGFKTEEKSLVAKGEQNKNLKASEQQLKTAEQALSKGIAPALGTPDLTTGSGMPAYSGTGPAKPGRPSKEMKSLAELAQGDVFVPGGQLMDIVRNATGQAAYTENLSKYGFPQTQKEAYATSRAINESLGRAARDEAIAKGADLGENTKSITKERSKGGKLVRIAGVAGAVIPFTELANAKDVARGVGEALLPLGATPSPVESGKIPSLERKELYDQFILNQPGNRAELEAKTKGKSPAEANKIREEYLATAPISDFERASRVFRQQADSKKGIAPPSMR